jgi:hypothetical protein
MLITHEVPFSLLEMSREFNDIDYVLVHLLEDYPNYYKFFEKSLAMGRTVILDNSIFELEEVFDADRFAYWVERLKPTEYIIPDVLDNSTATIESCMNWITEYSHLPGKTIGVIQGATVEDAIECYSTISLLVDKVAISFNCKFYEYLYPHTNKLFSWMHGRQMFIDLLIDEGIINISQPFHLLGIALPQEIQHYKSGYDFIESIDTSNPIVHAINNISYKSYGLDSKVSEKMINYLHYTEIDHNILNHNIKKFRSFIK